MPLRIAAKENRIYDCMFMVLSQFRLRTFAFISDDVLTLREIHSGYISDELIVWILLSQSMSIVQLLTIGPLNMFTKFVI